MASNFLQRRRFHLADEVLSRLLKLYQPYVQTIHNSYTACFMPGSIISSQPACVYHCFLPTLAKMNQN